MVEIKLPNGKHTVLGVMTGNSMDGVDVGVFEVKIGQAPSGQQAILGFSELRVYSEEMPTSLRTSLLRIRDGLRMNFGQVPDSLRAEFNATSIEFHESITSVVERSIGCNNLEGKISLIGIHGQSLGHLPPSLSKGAIPYTIQLGNGAYFSRKLGFPVVADFRSDDILNGGEGAPLAPAFNLFLLPLLKVNRAIFINAGNTSNVSKVEIGQAPFGYDCGPCNHFPDLLVREERGVPFDQDGVLSRKGRVVPELLSDLWNGAVVNGDGKSVISVSPPRSFDPQWYRLPVSMSRNSKYVLEDRLRSSIAFAALCIANAIAEIGQAFAEKIILFGGGWNNPLLEKDLIDLCCGKSWFELDRPAFPGLSKKLHGLSISVEISRAVELGLPDRGMEAGIFAFAAVQRVLKNSLTYPQATGCRSPTVCGEIFCQNSSDPVRSEPWLSRAAPGNLPP